MAVQESNPFKRLGVILVDFNPQDKFRAGNLLGYQMAIRDLIGNIEDGNAKKAYEKVDEDITSLLKEVYGEPLVNTLKDFDAVASQL